MRIRSKLLLLLLGLTLPPLALLTYIEHRALSQMGDKLTGHAVRSLEDRLAGEMRRAVEAGADILGRERDLVELAVDLLVREAERQLAGPVVDGVEPVPLASRFDGQGETPPGLHPSPAHFRIDADTGRRRALPISLRVPSVRLAPGTPADDPHVVDLLARLSGLGLRFKDLHLRHPGLFYWTYLSLEEGIHLAYPGHGGYPEAYDARPRPWYQAAQRAGGKVWSAPYIDAASRELVVTLSAPVQAADGRFAGVAGIDVQVFAALSRVARRLSLSEETRSFLVRAEQRPDGTPGLRILAHPTYRSQDWTATVELGWMEGEEGGAFARLRDDLAHGRSGVQRLGFDGRDSIWAAAPIPAFEAALLIVVPFTEIEAQAALAEETVRAELLGLSGAAGLLSLGLIALVVLVALIVAGTVTRPLSQLSGAARRLAAGDFAVRAEVSGRDEIAQLARRFNEMVPHLADLLRLRRSIGLAQEVQRSLLPETAPRLPGLDVAGSSVYCDETGGDYFDYLGPEELGPGRLCVAVGDVSGHGVPAALLMTSSRALLRAQARGGEGPAAVVGAVNRHLARDVRGGRFMTLFHLILETDPAGSPVATWVDAGHGGALLYNPGVDWFVDLAGDGIPLGVDGQWSYTESGPRVLEPDCLIAIGTDGVWETRDAAGEPFGGQRFRDALRRAAGRPAGEVLASVLADLDRFRGEAPRRDDVTLVIVKAVGV